MINRKWIAAGISSFICVFAIACSGGGSDGPQDNANADTEIALLAAQTGHSYTLVENPTQTNGYAVYQDNATGEYVAVNYAGYSAGMTLGQLQALNNNEGLIRNLTYYPGQGDSMDCCDSDGNNCGCGDATEAEDDQPGRAGATKRVENAPARRAGVG